jgi:hypothetical protein
LLEDVVSQANRQARRHPEKIVALPSNRARTNGKPERPGAPPQPFAQQEQGPINLMELYQEECANHSLVRRRVERLEVAYNTLYTWVFRLKPWLHYLEAQSGEELTEMPNLPVPNTPATEEQQPVPEASAPTETPEAPADTDAEKPKHTKRAGSGHKTAALTNGTTPVPDAEPPLPVGADLVAP